MKKVLLCASLISMLIATANAANVIWQAPITISGASDVNTSGAYFGSWAPYNQAAVDNNGLVVNGVKFQAFSDLPGLSTTGVNSGYNAYANPNTPDTNYNSLMQTAGYNGNGGGGITISWGGMTPGDTYLFQFWANDGRGNGRSETLTGGANTSASLVFGNFPGQYIIGTFVADNSGSETIALSGAGSVNGDYPQVNLLQVRDLTPVPEPSTLGLLAAGAGIALFGFRRKCRASPKAH